jgi:hypothetical protein
MRRYREEISMTLLMRDIVFVLIHIFTDSLHIACLAPGPLRGQRRRYTRGYQQWVWTPWESIGPPYVRTGPPGKVPNLHGRARTPLCRVRATHSKVPGFWDKEYPGLDQGQAGVRSRHVSGPYRVRFRSPLRWRPDAAAWPTARDVSHRAEPEVRLLGRASSAFITDKTRRLTGDVPPRHLMSLVHSTDRRCAASAFNVPLSTPLTGGD